MKKLLFSAALIMGAAAVSFAGNPKGETKDANTAKTEAKAGNQLFWYDVVYDGAHPNGYVPTGSIPSQEERSEAEDGCPAGEAKLCKVGYSQTQTLPLEDFSTATDDIKRSN